MGMFVVMEWFQRARKGFIDTLKFFGFNIRTGLVFLLYPIGHFYSTWTSGEAVKMDWGLYLVLIFVIGLFMKNVFAAPLKIERSKIRSAWSGSRYVPSRVIEKHILIKVSHPEPIVCTLPCPPNSLAQIRYEIPHYLGNVFLAIRQVGASDLPSLSGSGTVDVIVNQDRQIELIAIPQAGLNTGNVPIAVRLLGWTES